MWYIRTPGVADVCGFYTELHQGRPFQKFGPGKSTWMSMDNRHVQMYNSSSSDKCSAVLLCFVSFPPRRFDALERDGDAAAAAGAAADPAGTAAGVGRKMAHGLHRSIPEPTSHRLTYLAETRALGLSSMSDCSAIYLSARDPRDEVTRKWVTARWIVD